MKRLKMIRGGRGMGQAAPTSVVLDEHVHHDPRGRLWIIERLSANLWQATSDAYAAGSNLHTGSTRSVLVAKIDAATGGAKLVASSFDWDSPEAKRTAAVSGLGFGAASTGLAVYLHKNRHPVWAGIFGFLGVSSLVTGVASLATMPPKNAGTGMVRRRVRMVGR